MERKFSRLNLKLLTVIFFCLYLIPKGLEATPLKSNLTKEPQGQDFSKAAGEDKYIHKKFPSKNVDHSDPSIFAQPTEQTTLSPDVVEKNKRLFPGYNDMEKIKKIHSWVKENFEGYRGGGRMVAKQSAQQIYDSRRLSGCNDWGLLQTAILRSVGFPVVFMNAANINWAKEYKKNPANSRGFSGHTFLEIYVNQRWILMDSTTGQYIEDYDFNDPVLHIHKKRGGYFVYQKGLDQWNMGIRSIQDNEKIMKDFALNYPLETILIQDKEVKRLVPLKK